MIKRKKKTINLLVLLFLAMVLLPSCKTMYRANKVNTPIFKKQGELQTELVTGSGGVEVQAAYSLTNNFAILLNGVYDNSNVRVMDTLQGVKNGNSEYSNIFGEVAIGYYNTFGRDTSKMFAMYIGGGTGQTKGYSDLWSNNFLKYNSTYNRIFWQPTYGVFVKKNVEIAGALRFSFLNYKNLSIKDDWNTKYQTGSFDFYVEPVFTVKAGYEQFKFVMQIGSSLPLKKQNYYSVSPVMISFGFHLNFTRYWEKEDKYFGE